MKRGLEAVVIARAAGATIRSFRKQIGIAQEAFALECGIDRAYMSRLERGEHTPGLDTIYKVLPRLGISFTDFAVELELNIRRLKHQRKKEPPAA